ncbi:MULTISPECIES: hypothetical protein [unclassified Pseudovibrio]|uniref:hypothetical protein n=1 Tax=unclassified Pseudovibrio TaxID=2627060 RepID=UPI00070E833D|nr:MULTISPECIES: hypothetical protein [unclassified Pseudovibrio]
MHILILIVGVLSAACLWWYRIKQMSKAGREVSEAVSKTARRLRADQQTHRSSVAPMLHISDPVTAASTLILSIISEGKEVPRNVEIKLHQVLCEITNPDEASAAVAEGKRLQRKTSRTLDVVQVLGEMLRDRLSAAEQQHLIQMIYTVFAACPKRPAHTSNYIVALRQVLGLTEHAS